MYTTEQKDKCENLKLLLLFKVGSEVIELQQSQELEEDLCGKKPGP